MDKLQPERILCPTDFSDMATFALQYAKVMAESFQARLIVLYAETFEPPPYFTSNQEMDLVKSLARSRCQSKEMIRKGNAAEQVLEAAASTNCDMIVVGAQHKRLWDTTVIGTTTMNVIRHAPCPVLTVISKRIVRTFSGRD